MTLEQEQHLEDIIDEFADLTDSIYRGGAKEHGGNLWDMTPLQLVENAIEESIDSFTYLYTLKQQLLAKK